MKKLIFILTIISFTAFLTANLSAKEILEQRGGKIKVIKYDDGTWQLLVDDKPYFIKGVMFVPVKIGEGPSQSTMRDWMYYDDDNDGLNDIAYQTWLDENNNNQRDPQEKVIGDFQLLKDMGCNTIRIYHFASDNPLLGNLYKENPSTRLQFDHPVNKQILRQLYNDYGVMVIMGNFLGAWTIGSGASWEEGTDYTNPQHRENIKKSVRAMVLDNKDEPYVLMWLLGNENNLGIWTRCNAIIHPEEYAKFIGELADMIHELDPDHPVAVCDGDNFNTLRQYAEHAQGIDIIGYNSYRGKLGFGFLWKEVKMIFDRPIFISEFGIFAYNTQVGEDQDMQLEYIKGCWQDIVRNSAENYGTVIERKLKPSGNSIGGVVFDWLDRWYMDGTPYEHNPGTRSWDSPDGLRHEEWFGITSMGDGHDPLLRQKRKAYDYLKEAWNQ
ncbi:MAG: hypothetical protein JXA79_00295 [Deltaproteobacteria bacterium]|nr:hypothetical protein [Deltaproteobacteria bacterium]